MNKFNGQIGRNGLTDGNPQADNFQDALLFHTADETT
jgi:hypothetical protein